MESMQRKCAIKLEDLFGLSRQGLRTASLLKRRTAQFNTSTVGRKTGGVFFILTPICPFRRIEDVEHRLEGQN